MVDLRAIRSTSVYRLSAKYLRILQTIRMYESLYHNGLPTAIRRTLQFPPPKETKIIRSQLGTRSKNTNMKPESIGLERRLQKEQQNGPREERETPHKARPGDDVAVLQKRAMHVPGEAIDVKLRRRFKNRT